MISLRVYFPALEGIRLRMSGRLGSMGRMNPGTLSYIAWTPEIISFASFSSILVPLRAVFILLALIFPSNFSRSIYLGRIHVRQSRRGHVFYQPIEKDLKAHRFKRSSQRLG